MGLLSLLPVRAWAFLGIALALSVLVWSGYSAVFNRGVASAEARHAIALAESIERAQAQAREIALQDAEVIQEGAAERERIRTVYRNREIELVKYVPIDCAYCRIAPPGVGLLNDALGNAKPPTADPGSQPPPLPGPTVPDQGGDYSRGLRDLSGRGRKVL